MPETAFEWTAAVVLAVTLAFMLWCWTLTDH